MLMPHSVSITWPIPTYRGHDYRVRLVPQGLGLPELITMQAKPQFGQRF